jgi:hypothetical protein
LVRVINIREGTEKGLLDAALSRYWDKARGLGAEPPTSCRTSAGTWPSASECRGEGTGRKLVIIIAAGRAYIMIAAAIAHKHGNSPVVYKGWSAEFQIKGIANSAKFYILYWDQVRQNPDATDGLEPGLG